MLRNVKANKMGPVTTEIMGSTPSYGYGASPADYLGLVTANQISEIRGDVGAARRDIKESEANIRDNVRDAEAEIRQSIHAQSLANGMEFCGINRNISDNAHRNVQEILENRTQIKVSQCELEKSVHDAHCEIDKTVLENRYLLHDNILKTENNLTRLFDSETDRIKDQMKDFEVRNAEKFCEVKELIKDNTRLVLERMTSDKIDEKNDEISRLRSKATHWENQLNFSNQQNKLESMINSIAQEQKFQSKVSQFGIGNVATPVQTANQG